MENCRSKQVLSTLPCTKHCTMHLSPEPRMVTDLREDMWLSKAKLNPIFREEIWSQIFLTPKPKHVIPTTPLILAVKNPIWAPKKSSSMKRNLSFIFPEEFCLAHQRIWKELKWLIPGKIECDLQDTSK